MPPIYQITADGKDITEAIRARSASITVDDSNGTDSDSLTINLSRYDLQGRPMAVPPDGAELEIKAGYVSPSSLTPPSAFRLPPSGDIWSLGIFAVDEIEVTQTAMTITAKAANFASRGKSLANNLKSQRSQSWDNVTISDIVRTIAARTQYTPVIAEKFANTQIPNIVQQDESDINFLTRLAADHDAVSKPVNGNLLFVPKGHAKTASGEDLPPVILTLDQIAEDWRVTIKQRAKFASVKAFYYDQAAAKKESVIVPDAGAGQVAAQPVKCLGRTYPTKAEAKAAAASYNTGNRGTQELTCSITGAPIFAESALTLDLG